MSLGRGEGGHKVTPTHLKFLLKGVREVKVLEKMAF
jgi:hypothetical protein